MGPVVKLWTKERPPSLSWIKKRYKPMINFVEAGPFVKVTKCKFYWRGYTGWKYVENIGTYADRKLEDRLKAIAEEYRARHA